MADKKSDNSAAESGGSKRLIVIVVMCVVIAGAGFVLGGRLSGGGAAESAEAVEEPTEELPKTKIDEIVELEPLNVNLAGGHYLRVAVAIALHHDEEHAEESGGGGGHGGGGDDEDAPSIATAPASDLVLTTFAGRDMQELATPEGREAARHDLHEGLVAFYGESIITVLFTEFVMQ